MIVLGIDPGYDRIGVAVAIKEDRKEKILFSTCIETNREKDFSKRLLQLGKGLEKIILKWKPNVLAIETLFFQQNKKTAMRVAEARGVIIFIAEQNKMTIQEIGPGTIKASITGNGRASKNEVIKMVQLTTNVKEAKHDDEYDAVAIAITGLLTIQHNLPQ